MNILPLFSLPVLIDKYPNSFDDELKYIRSLSTRNRDRQQVGSTSFSQDDFILNHSKMKKVRVWIQEKINYYINNILGSSNKVFITQSWVVFGSKGQSLHIHNHPNSIVSAVWYPYLTREQSPLILTQLGLPFNLELKIKNDNQWNSKSVAAPLETGHLIIFPSSVYHSVDVSHSNDTRISLALNTWTTDEVGNRDIYTSNSTGNSKGFGV